jgi:Ran GTPase-activating protein (RanGAP) involved in mRNA processing and transport
LDVDSATKGGLLLLRKMAKIHDRADAPIRLCGVWFCSNRPPFLRAGSRRPRAILEYVQVKRLHRAQLDEFGAVLFSRHVGIQELDFHGIELTSSMIMVSSYLSGNMHLCALDISECSVRANGIKAFAIAVSACPHLRKLNVIRNNFGVDGARAMLRVFCASSLSTLCGIVDTDTVVDWRNAPSGRCADLILLGGEMSRSTDGGATNNIEEILMDNNPRLIGEVDTPKGVDRQARVDAFATFCEGLKAPIQRLSLRNIGLGPETFLILAQSIVNTPTLTDLNVSDNKLRLETADDLWSLACESLSNSKLVTLNMSKCGLRHAVVPDLIKLIENMPRLRSMTLSFAHSKSVYELTTTESMDLSDRSLSSADALLLSCWLRRPAVQQVSVSLAIGDNAMGVDGGKAIAAVIPGSNLTQMVLTNHAIVPIGDFSVKSLDFSSRTLLASDIIVLAAIIPTLPSLQSLTTNSTGTETLLSVLYTLRTDDTSLDLSDKNFGPADFVLISAWLCKPVVLDTLKQLTMVSTGYDSQPWTLGLQPSIALVEKGLSGSDILLLAAWLSKPQQKDYADKLTICLQGNYISDSDPDMDNVLDSNVAGLACLGAALDSVLFLEELDLSECLLGPHAAKALCDSVNWQACSLISLQLTGNCIDMAAFGTIVESIASAASLESLNMCDNPLCRGGPDTSVGVDQWQRLCQTLHDAKGLRRFDISGCGITALFVPALVDLVTAMMALESLTLDTTGQPDSTHTYTLNITETKQLFDGWSDFGAADANLLSAWLCKSSASTLEVSLPASIGLEGKLAMAVILPHCKLSLLTLELGCEPACTVTLDAFATDLVLPFELSSADIHVIANWITLTSKRATILQSVVFGHDNVIRLDVTTAVIDFSEHDFEPGHVPLLAAWFGRSCAQKHIESFNISNNPLFDAAEHAEQNSSPAKWMELCKSLRKVSKLKTLLISNIGMNSAGASCLAMCFGQHLQCLNISGNRLFVDGAERADHEQQFCRSLASVSIATLKMVDVGLNPKSLGQFANICLACDEGGAPSRLANSITLLDLSNQPLATNDGQSDISGFQTFCSAICEQHAQLSSLTLINCGLTSPCLEQMATCLEQMATTATVGLRTLNISNNPVSLSAAGHTDTKGVAALSRAVAKSHMRVLDLSGYQMPRHGVFAYIFRHHVCLCSPYAPGREFADSCSGAVFNEVLQCDTCPVCCGFLTVVGHKKNWPKAHMTVDPPSLHSLSLESTGRAPANEEGGPKSFTYRLETANSTVSLERRQLSGADICLLTAWLTRSDVAATVTELNLSHNPGIGGSGAIKAWSDENLDFLLKQLCESLRFVRLAKLLLSNCGMSVAAGAYLGHMLGTPTKLRCLMATNRLAKRWKTRTSGNAACVSEPAAVLQGVHETVEPADTVIEPAPEEIGDYLLELDVSANELGEGGIQNLANTLLSERIAKRFRGVWLSGKQWLPLQDGVSALAYQGLRSSDVIMLSCALQALPSLDKLTVNTTGSLILNMDQRTSPTYTLTRADESIDLRALSLAAADVMLLSSWLARPSVGSNLRGLYLSGNDCFGSGWEPDQNVEVFRALLQKLGATAITELDLASSGLGKWSAEMLVDLLAEPEQLKLLRGLDVSGNGLGLPSESKARLSAIKGLRGRLTQQHNQLRVRVEIDDGWVLDEKYKHWSQYWIDSQTDVDVNQC